MAALTADRKGTVKVKPVPMFTDHPLAAADTVIFAHSLVSIDANGDVLPATAGGTNPVAYADRHYDADSNNLHRGQAGEEDVARVLHGAVVLLNATGLTAADVGANAYVDDDNTVSTSADEGTETRPLAGEIVRVITATEAFVRVPGLAG